MRGFSNKGLQGINDLQQQLALFRHTHSYTRRCVGDVNWQYILCGHGQEALLLLPGVTGLGETAFQYIVRFEHTYRIIVPNYPSSLSTVAQLVDGLVEVLAAENFHKFHIVGGSYGGMLAQCFVRRYPDRVGKLVLDHVSVPRVERAGKYRAYSRVLSLLPLLFTRFLLRLAKNFALLRLPTQRVFWSSYYDELVTAIVKDDYLSRIQVAVDFDECYRFTCDDLLDWPGEILILESDDDALVPREEREALKLLYPHARVYTFHGTSHFAWVTRCAELLCVIEDFLGEGR